MRKYITMNKYKSVITVSLNIFANFSNKLDLKIRSIYYLESIEVSDCSSYPCRIVIGSTVNVTTNFLVQGTAYDSEELVQNVYFVVSSIQLQAQVSPDPCTAVQGSNACRLENGRRVKYQAAVRVDNVPPLRGTLWWTMTNSAHELLVCYKLTVIFTLA
ncbi:uncharacterized protein LOC124308507 isoform X3 [Neodiprion virginianus]|uniref:uncharacterized protein LOC124308507 isoform X3 n=1 Tax=Neodiprion virginianus TaxID=2961670 RepID=UPI001EE724C6|nr:uncharacterized protein LOC124308507 isoform X3 [Neodiprion virginianus]